MEVLRHRSQSAPGPAVAQVMRTDIRRNLMEEVHCMRRTRDDRRMQAVGGETWKPRAWTRSHDGL